MLDTIITFFVSGVIFGAVYDFFRFFRFVFKNKSMVFLLDFLYFTVISIAFFILLLGQNNGMVRAYFVLLSFLGFVFYIFTVFRLTEKFEKPISLIIRKLFKKILHFIKRLYYNLFNSFKHIKCFRRRQKGKGVSKQTDESVFSEAQAK